jgi:hypothetical protein
MAGTGGLLFLFVIGHLEGNLQVFGPPELINTYAHFLQSKPLLVWGARIGLLVVVALHITTAVQLSVANKEARPVNYALARIVPPEGVTIDVDVLDAREKYQRCARSWKRRPDVGSDLKYPDLSARDAAAVRALRP